MVADIDECMTNNGGCEYNCSDTIGSFQCSCPVGFELGLDLRACLGKFIMKLTNSFECQKLLFLCLRYERM